MSNFGGRGIVFFGRWAKLILDYLFGSGIGQILGLLGGLLYVRSMVPSEYALYGLCLTTLSSVALLSDLGLTGSVTYFWRYAKEQNEKFYSYLKVIRYVRRCVLLGALLCSLVALLVVGEGQGVERGILIAAWAVLSITSAASISVSVDLQVLRMLGEFRKTYLVEFAGQAIRFGFALIFFLGFASSALFALVGGAVGAWFSWLVADKNFPGSQSLPDGIESTEPGKKVFKYIVPVAPTVAVYALQDTAILWLAALFASQNSVAEVFALGRIAAVLGIVNSFVILVLIPKIINIKTERKFLFASVGARVFLGVLGGIGVLVCWLEPSFPLLLLGPTYAKLESEVFIVVLTGAFTLVNTATVLINRAKGWVRLDPVVALFQVFGVVIIVTAGDLSNTAGVVAVMSAAVFLSLVLNTLVNVLGELFPRSVKIG